MLHDIGRMGNDAGNEDLAGREFDLVPDRNFVLVPSIGAFDQKGLRFDLEHDVDDLRSSRSKACGPCQLPQHR